jgi:hypothetical protein
MPTKVYIGDPVVVPLLTKMRLPRERLWEIASKTGGERANVAAHEPPNVAGFETWRWGTRFCREDETLQKLGWSICEENQVSGIRNAELGIKLVVCGTNVNTGNPTRSPRSLSERGPNSCKLIARNSGQITMDFAKGHAHDDFWYCCFHFSEQFIAIEVSRPDFQIGGIVTSFSDRIIVAKPGDIPGIRKVVVPQEFAEVPKPQVTRKNG